MVDGPDRQLMRRERRLLVIEDEPLSREILTRLLASSGFAVDGVDDGPSGMEWLEQNEADLVLLDISLPGMSGLELLRWIRRRRSHEQLPVILVSALVEAETVVNGLDSGANDYVVKPFNPPILLARIRTCLRLKQDVERLVDAERHRMMLEALGDAARKLQRPVGAVNAHLDELLAEVSEVSLRARLEEVQAWAGDAADLIERFRTVAAYRTIPYTEGMGSLVSASLGGAASARARPSESTS